MIRVTFTNQSGVYWAVCETLSHITMEGGYLLSSLQEDSARNGPHPWAKVPEDWKIILVEEV